MFNYQKHSSNNKTAFLMHAKHTIRTRVHSRLPEEEPSGSKHVEDKKLKIKILIYKKAHFFVLLVCCIITLQCTVQRTYE
jgi:hypothetical protein